MYEKYETSSLSFFRILQSAIITLMALVVLTCSQSVYAAQAKQLIPLGRAVGIKLFSDGVLVVGTSPIDGQDPAGTSGLRQGDIITHINSREVDSIEEVRSLLQDIGGTPMSIRATRGEKQIQLTAQAVQCAADGTYKLGAWIRDSMAGIGTLTYFDPADSSFGALGHGINDVDTSLLMPLERGSLMYAEITDVAKGTAGTPGELHGQFQVHNDLGSLSANTASGIFGTLTQRELTAGTQAYPIAARKEIKPGKASILSNIAGTTVEEYDVEILRIYSNSENDTRDMMIKITDPRLLDATGGIVQGMSGSPILQNGKFIGAVTHVLVNDPTRGYGIYIGDMMEAG